MKEKLLVVAGPTAVGKSELAIKLAHHFNGEIISGEDSGETDDLDTEASVQPEEPIAPEPEYAPWSSRKKEKSTETDIPGFTEEEKEDNATSGQEDFGTEEADREVSEMEKSLDDVQANEDDTSVDGVTDTITGQDNDTPLAGRGAYVVSKPTITDDNLSDTKDESFLGMFSRKHKHNKKEN